MWLTVGLGFLAVSFGIIAFVVTRSVKNETM